MRVPTSVLFEKAYGKFCIPAINVSNPEQVLGLFSAAKKFNAPFIIQTTPAARDYASPSMLINYINAAEELYPGLVFAVHLDHGNEKHAADAIASNAYTSVMIDASHDSFVNNIERTKAVVELARPKNISVEAELGVLSGVEDDLSVDESNALYTDPNKVKEFVEATHCTSLAVAVGTSHGAYKFSQGEGLRFDLLEQIQRKLPHFPIVLHGASTIDPKEIDRINKAGGNLSKKAKGITEEDIKKAIGYGICKLNIATDLRLLWTRIFREFFLEYSGEWDHLKPGKQYMEELEYLLEQKFVLLNAKNKANLYK